MGKSSSIMHRWPDIGTITHEVGPCDQVVANPSREPKKSGLCGAGWCDCRTLELTNEEPQLVLQERCFHEVSDVQNKLGNTEVTQFQVETKPMHVFADGSTYTGDWQDEERCGHGIQVWQDGACYEGEWLRGTAHGQGRFMHPNGDVYEGGWMLDRAHGFGTYTHKDGSMYTGDWSHDLQDGRGMEIWSDGGRYEGDYVGGLKHGEGKLSWCDGSLYQGEFRQNSIHGNGTYSWADGRRYVGQWDKNQMHGRGQFIWADGRSYDGEYADDVKHGIGMFQCADGRIFAGRWSNGELIVGGQDLADEADEREAHPGGISGHAPPFDDRSMTPTSSAVPGLTPRPRIATAKDSDLLPRRGAELGYVSNASVDTQAGTSCESEASHAKQSLFQDDADQSSTFPALPELTESVKGTTPRKRCTPSEVVRIGSRAPGSAPSLRCGLTFGELAVEKLTPREFPERKHLPSLKSTVHELVAQQRLSQHWRNDGNSWGDRAAAGADATA